MECQCGHEYNNHLGLIDPETGDFADEPYLHACTEPTCACDTYRPQDTTQIEATPINL